MNGAQKFICTLALMLCGCTHPPAAPTEAPAKSVTFQTVKMPAFKIEQIDSAQMVENVPVITPEIKTVISEDPEIEKLAQGLENLKTKTYRGLWWECGRKYETKEEIRVAAKEWAAAIVEAHKTTSYKLRSGKVVHPSIREAVGIMINESNFDRCAIGIGTRKYAYKSGLLTRPKNSISHSMQEIAELFPKIEGRRVDLGPGQIVERVGKNYMDWDTVQTYLTVVPGVQKVFHGMAYRGRIYNTQYPSLHWPGSQKHVWYRDRVMRLTIPMFGSYTPPADI